MLRLVKASEEYRQQLCDMPGEWRSELEQTGAKPIPGPIFRGSPVDTDTYSAQLEHKEASDGIVPDSVFFLYDDERDILLGAVHIRHYLNDALRSRSGHIGIGIRPSERRKGYASHMLKLALDECRNLGIDKVQITCDKQNTGSAKAIVRNGGILEKEYTEENGTVRQRYIIYSMTVLSAS